MLGGSAHGSGVAKANMAGPQQGVAASLVSASLKGQPRFQPASAFNQAGVVQMV